MHCLPALHSTLIPNRDRAIPAGMATPGVDTAHVVQKGPFWCGHLLHSPRIPAGQLGSGTTFHFAISEPTPAPRPKQLCGGCHPAVPPRLYQGWSDPCYSGNSSGSSPDEE